jgi:hypothetical protein
MTMPAEARDFWIPREIEMIQHCVEVMNEYLTWLELAETGMVSFAELGELRERVALSWLILDELRAQRRR